MAQRSGNAGCWTESVARQAGDGSATQFDITSGEAGVSLDQWSRSASVWPELWIVDAVVGGRTDERKSAIRLGVTAVGELLAKLGLTPQKPLQRAYQRDPEAIEAWRLERYPAIARQAKASGGEVYFWDESGFRADSVHGRTWGKQVKRLWSNALASGNRSVRPRR